MKIAFLIMAFDRPIHLKKLIEKINCKEFHFYIHIDANSNIEEFKYELAHIDNCFFIKNREHIMWGSISVVLAMISLLKQANKSCHYDRFQLLSGHDYPIKSKKELLDFYKNNHSNFITTWKIFNKNSLVQNNKIYKYHMNHIPIFNKKHGERKNSIIKRSFIIFVSNLFKFFSYKLMPNRNLPSDLYKGNMWFSVNNEFVESFLEWLKTCEGKEMIKFSKYLPCPDEIVINTFANIYFKKDIVSFDEKYIHGLHFIQWSNKSGPGSINASNLIDLKKSSALFARKFDNNSDKILKEIDSFIST